MNIKKYFSVLILLLTCNFIASSSESHLEPINRVPIDDQERIILAKLLKNTPIDEALISAAVTSNNVSLLLQYAEEQSITFSPKTLRIALICTLDDEKNILLLLGYIKEQNIKPSVEDLSYALNHAQYSEGFLPLLQFIKEQNIVLSNDFSGMLLVDMRYSKSFLPLLHYVDEQNIKIDPEYLAGIIGHSLNNNVLPLLQYINKQNIEFSQKNLHYILTGLDCVDKHHIVKSTNAILTLLPQYSIKHAIHDSPDRISSH